MPIANLLPVFSWGLLSLEILLSLLCLGALWFYGFAIYAAIDCFADSRLGHTPKIDPGFHPPVTLLKPLCGLNGDDYATLASFCQQDYPLYQLVFAVREANDPAIAVVQKLMAQFPEQDMDLVIDGREIGANPKVSNLQNGLAQAKYDILLISDSDIFVGHDYLLQVVQPLQAQSVGVVTCLYRALAHGWGATLEALGTATDFHAGVLVARKLEGMTFALGATVVMRRSVLEEIGGFAAIADYLADDFQLGNRPVMAGHTVVLSNYVVEHRLADSSILQSIQRQIRWARGIRVSRPWGYAGMIFTYGTVTSLLLWLLGRSELATISEGHGYMNTDWLEPFTWILLGITWCARLTMGWVVGVWGLNDPSARKLWWLSPFRDLVSFMVWLCGFVGNTIIWRDLQLELRKDGKLARTIFL